MLIYRDTELGLEVKIEFDRYDSFHGYQSRSQWRWEISDTSSEIVASGDDLRTSEPSNELTAIRSFTTFLFNWADAVKHMEETGEQWDHISLFPSEMYEAAGGEVWHTFACTLRNAFHSWNVAEEDDRSSVGGAVKS